MYITGAMINSKNVLEMKLNNSIVYSAAPVSYPYNYYFQHGNTNVPSWIDKSLLFNFYNNGFHFQSDSLPFGVAWFTNTTTTRVPGQIFGYLMLDLTNCTTDLKIDVYSYFKVTATRHGAGAYIQVFRNSSATSIGSLTNGKTIGSYGDANNGSYNTGTATITQADIAVCKHYAIRFYVYGGATTGSVPQLHIRDVTFTQV